MAFKRTTLTPRQERFCHEYMIDCSPTHAAVRAGFSANDHEVKTRLMKNPLVLAKIDELQTEQQQRTHITASRVIDELAKIAFCNIQDFVDEENGVVKLKEVTAEKAVAVGSVKVTRVESKSYTRTVTTLKLHDKLDALVQLGKHLGIFKDKPQIQNFIKQIVIE